MFKGGLLKWVIGDFVFDSLFGPLVGIISKAVRPLADLVFGKTLPSIGEKVAEMATAQLFSLLGESEYDEKIILKAMNTIADKNIVRGFHRKMLLLQKWFTVDHLSEYVRRLISEKTPEETAELIVMIGNMNDDEWREYLLSTGIDHKDLRTKAEIGKEYFDQFTSAAAKQWKKLRRKLDKQWSATVQPAWLALRKRARYLIIGFAGVVGVLVILVMFAYAYRFMAAFSLFLILAVLVISFVRSAYNALMTFVIFGLSSLGLVPPRYVRPLIALVQKQSFLRYSRAAEIVLLHLATAALVYPSVLYYSVFWVYAAVAAMACMVYMIARDTTTSWLVQGLGIHYFIFLLLLLFPQPVESAHLEFNNLKKKVTLFNNDRYIATRTIFEVTEKTSGWQVADVDELGKPIKKDGHYRMTPCYVTGANDTTAQMEFVPGKKYQVSEDGETLDAGEAMIKARAQNADGTWLITDKTVECYIPFSKTDLAVAKPKPTPVPVTTPTVVAPSQPAPAKVVAVERSFYMQASEVYRLGIHVRRGQRVQITASGQINTMPEDRRTDRAYRWVGPDGWGSSIPGFITKATGSFAGPLPEGAPYLALAARVSSKAPSLSDGNWILIGSNNSFIADQDGYLYLVVNEKSKNQAGIYQPEWLSNNQGGLQIEVSVL